MAIKFTDNAATTLAASIGATDPTLTVASGFGDNFPAVDGADADYFVVTMEDSSGNTEFIRVDHRPSGSDTLGSGVYPCTRGYFSSAARTWSSGDIVDLRWTAEGVDLIRAETTSEITTTSAAAVTYENLNANGDVGTGATQVAQGDHNHYSDAVANFTGVLQNGGSDVVVDTDIGATVEPRDATIIKQADVDNAPASGATTAPISSDWAYRHENSATAHGVDGKADKVTGATNGALAGLDASGNLTDSGVPASTVLVDGDIGATVQGYNAANGAFGSALLHVQDQKTSGTSGGSSVAGLNIRDLNTVLTSEIVGASLNTSTGVITLPAGTYYIHASFPSYATKRHKIRVMNLTTSTYMHEIEGTSEFSYQATSGFAQTHSISSGRFILTAQSDLRFDHYVEFGSPTSGLGVPCGSYLTIDHEIYSDVKIWKIA